MSSPYTELVYKQELAIRQKVEQGDVSLEQILIDVFDVDLNQLNDQPEWGQVSHLYKRIAGILHITESAVKKWHKKDPDSQRIIYFADIPLDRLYSLRYYYYSLNPVPYVKIIP